MAAIHSTITPSIRQSLLTPLQLLWPGWIGIVDGWADETGALWIDEEGATWNEE